MHVDPKVLAGAVAWLPTHQPAVRRSPMGEDQVSFASAEALDHGYQDVPDSRSDAVARAKELVTTANYPPPETIKRIANLLAMQLSTDRK